MASVLRKVSINKQSEVTAFSSTAIALYGYDQGMMSLINTNYDYLATMGIAEESPLVAVIVSVYYLGTAVGAVLASWLADKRGRKPSIFACLAVTVVGNFVMFMSGLGYSMGALWIMLVGRFVMGLGVGGIDAVIPVYSAELNDSGNRGRAMAQEFQANILGLNVAFGLNLAMTRALSKSDQWAWRVPIIAMDVFPLLLLSIIYRLPESPRWLLHKDREDDAKQALGEVYGEDDAPSELDDLKKAKDKEASRSVGYADMLILGGSQFHPTIITIFGQVNQALTGYGCISVYGPQTFELLGYSVDVAENITQANYLSYFALMTVCWLTIDNIGRRKQMIWGSMVLILSFLLLTFFGGVVNSSSMSVNKEAFSVLGVIVLFVATAAFGIGWLPQPWLIPTEIYPSTARAQGAAISVVIWGIMNFAVTFLSPIFFNNLKYWIFLIFAGSNTFAGFWTWALSPETGGRALEQNEKFFRDAKDQETWRIHKVDDGEFLYLPGEKKSIGGDDERRPLLR